MKTDLLIAGGGLGGCAAALAACKRGLKVVLTEESDWLGGQSTSQAVPPDEHPWIEEFGCTARYRDYRNRIRDYYMRNFPLKRKEPRLNPGKGIVSAICHDPRVSVAVLDEMLSPYVCSGQLTVLKQTIVKEVGRNGKTLDQAVLLQDGKREMTVGFSYIIDSTDASDVLPVAKIDYVTGSEAKSMTGEKHAADVSDPGNMQALTYVLAMEYREGEDHTIQEPPMYAFWKAYRPSFWPDQFLSFHAPNPVTLEKRRYGLFPNENHFPLWNYRRVYAADQFNLPGSGDISLMNWPQNDYLLGNVYDVTDEEKAKHLYQAKQLSLSLFYWLQTEAPRPDGGKGYPGLKLRGDVLGTEDGLAKSIYIREGRRIKACYTITEQDVSPESQEGKTGKVYHDSVGIGSYSIDLHPSLSGHNYIDIPALPFHIPLGALIPVECDNLLAGGKNIGTTHITNGCYRLHPVEWNIGEACGALAAFCILSGKKPFEVREEEHILKRFQETLIEDGFELAWPEDFYRKS